MAVDFGETRTGIAVSDSMEMLATPHGIITEKDTERAVALIAEKSKELRAEMIVVGLPVNMDGSEGERARKCRAVAAMLQEKADIPVELWDERGSTKTATYYMNETDTRGKKRKQVLDAAAATVILQSYLDYRRNTK